jgi:hypothetical protein
MNLVDDIPVLRGAMQVTSELVLTHLGPNIDTNGLPHTRVAEDLARYAL